MNHSNDNTEKPQSDVYVELSAVGQNQVQKGIIFSELNSLKQECEVTYEPHEAILDAGVYSFDLFYEPDITVDDAAPFQKTTDGNASNKIELKLKQSKQSLD
ncbi:hypothetical protein [Paenimyroides viscosum]|jgi:hypothetical protein|uniref:Uncharacterized protein n=1 Tax=Paenimyroides viscosum TaxID=2488729 RepID=A0A3P1B635_9FLAO|nr:hypothetical protein [Paenimyroides viscosum]RRA96505.1 hypothetical protein EG242_02595 [Paenimyroides viscosum]